SQTRVPQDDANLGIGTLAASLPTAGLGTRLGCLRDGNSLYEGLDTSRTWTVCFAVRRKWTFRSMDAQQRPAHALKRDVSSDGAASLFHVMRGLWPYIWPSDRPDLKLRVGVAMVLLLVAKLATMAVPFTFKWATDALTGEGSAPVAPDSWLLWVLGAPVLMVVAYGGMRILMAVLTQVRDGIFAKVAMHGVRRLAYRTFEHMHELSLRFHLERKTGGLTRVLERGRNAIETIVRMVIMQLVPTILEVALVVGVLLYQF